MRFGGLSHLDLVQNLHNGECDQYHTMMTWFFKSRFVNLGYCIGCGVCLSQESNEHDRHWFECRHWHRLGLLVTNPTQGVKLGRGKILMLQNICGGQQPLRVRITIVINPTTDIYRSIVSRWNVFMSLCWGMDSLWTKSFRYLNVFWCQWQIIRQSSCVRML